LPFCVLTILASSGFEHDEKTSPAKITSTTKILAYVFIIFLPCIILTVNSRHLPCLSFKSVASAEPSACYVAPVIVHAQINTVLKSKIQKNINRQSKARE